MTLYRINQGYLGVQLVSYYVLVKKNKAKMDVRTTKPKYLHIFWCRSKEIKNRQTSFERMPIIGGNWPEKCKKMYTILYSLLGSGGSGSRGTVALHVCRWWWHWSIIATYVQYMSGPFHREIEASKALSKSTWNVLDFTKVDYNELWLLDNLILISEPKIKMAFKGTQKLIYKMEPNSYRLT